MSSCPLSSNQNPSENSLTVLLDVTGAQDIGGVTLGQSWQSFAFPSHGQQGALCEALAGGPAVPEAEATGGEGTAGEEDAGSAAHRAERAELLAARRRLKRLSVTRRQQV